ncbi:MAG: glycosyltransferase family 39 protein [Novosphingobium sp.]|uniref:ArnT family glycosyltransferase n=1 Tax=Novosphingobium sp. TaxID=1874826 RepID=UPI0032BC36F2
MENTLRGSRPTTSFAALVLVLAVLTTQFVGLGREVIDPDETTFILMGADVANGHLPFVNQFDLKPPVIFLLIGGVLAAFGKSLVAVRLLGDFLLFGTALLTFSFARQIASGWAALGGALIYVAFASLDLGQPTYTELPALFFAMAALLALARTPVAPLRAGLAGLFLALAVLSRTNLYQLPIAFGLLLLIASLRKSDMVHPRAWLAFGMGGLVPVALLVIAYGLAQQLAVLKLAMIDVPLAYAAQVGPGEAILENIRQLYVTATIEPLILIPFAVLVAAGLWGAFVRRQAQPWPLLVATLALAGLLVSLAFSGAVYPHYWLQIGPVLALFAALGLDRLARLPKATPLALAAGTLPLAAAVAEQLPQGIAVVTDPSHTESAFEIAQAARFIKSNGRSHPSVWPWRKQLIDWYLDAPQLSKAGVQPENIARPAIIGPLAKAGYVGSDEIGRLMAMRPDFVVTDGQGKGLAWMRATGRPVDQWLAQNYELEAQFGDVLVYRRVN